MLNPRLKLAADLAAEWQALRDFLVTFDSRSRHAVATEFIDTCLVRIYSQINEKPWPPIWWRFLSIDAAFSDLSRWFFRIDGEGYFHDNNPGPFLPERDEILARVEDLQKRETDAKQGGWRSRAE
jgi:hypothetical protein